jgi:putative membrane protein
MDLFGAHPGRKNPPYSDVDTAEMSLRDHLATDRTFLSNQNTFLAYIRTALTLFVAGVTFIRFFDQQLVEIIGWTFIPVGVATFFVGLFRYNRLRQLLKRIQR